VVNVDEQRQDILISSGGPGRFLADVTWTIKSGNEPVMNQAGIPPRFELLDG